MGGWPVPGKISALCLKVCHTTGTTGFVTPKIASESGTSRVLLRAGQLKAMKSCQANIAASRSVAFQRRPEYQKRRLV